MILRPTQFRRAILRRLRERGFIVGTLWDKALVGYPRTTGPAPPSSGLHFWLKADALVLSNGDPVGSWADVSGNNNGTFTASGASRPTYQTGIINSLPAVYFSGSGPQNLAIGSNAPWNGLTSGEVFAILKGDSGQGSSFIGLWSFPPCDDFELYPYSGDSHVYDGFMSTLRKACGTPGASFQSVWHTYNVISTSSEYTAQRNGTQFFTTATNTVNTSIASVGSGFIGCSRGSFGFQGWFAEILLYDHKLSGTDRTAVYAYINSKYGI